MPFLPPNQQRQSTEGTYLAIELYNKRCTDRAEQHYAYAVVWLAFVCCSQFSEWRTSSSDITVFLV